VTVLGVVEWDKILEVIWVSLVVGLAAVSVFSLVVYSSSRAAEARRSGANPTIFGVLATIGMTAFMGIVAFGIITILNK
jgi:hypothetical protein